MLGFSARQPDVVLRPAAIGPAALHDPAAPAATVTLSSAAGIAPGTLDRAALTILGRRASPNLEASIAQDKPLPPPAATKPATASSAASPASPVHPPEATSAVTRALHAFLALPMTFMMQSRARL